MRLASLDALTAALLLLAVDCSSALLVSLHRTPKLHRRASNLQCSANAGDAFSFAALQKEVSRRDASEFKQHQTLNKQHALQKYGPHHTTSPKQVVEHIIREHAFARNSATPWPCRPTAHQARWSFPAHAESLSASGNISQAFAFTCVPMNNRGLHKSSTDWSKRMAWDRCRIINDEPSGQFYDHEAFAQMVRERYAPMLGVDGFRFLGDSSAWQQQKGTAKMTDPKQYVVEVKTRRGDHLILDFKLLYDWVRALL